MVNQATVDYIFEFLVGVEAAKWCSYGYREGARVIIEPSGFFDRPGMPSADVAEIDGMPILYGLPQIKTQDGTVHIYADVIAIAFFLMSRYEELLRPEVRDEHGRFPGRASWLHTHGYLQRPMVDEWGRWLRQKCREVGIAVPAERHEISKVYLTHDVDVPWNSSRIRQMVVGTVRTAIRRPWRVFDPVLDYVCGRTDYYTFPWLLQHDESVRGILRKGCCESIYFLLGQKNGTEEDVWYLEHPRFKKLLRWFHDFNVWLGLHGSYAAGGDMKNRISAEVGTVSARIAQRIVLHRHHYLRMVDPSDFKYLEKAGISDDYSVAYADVAGFRVGTCRPYRWIDPRTMRVGNMVVHPLTIMECTLSLKKYMGLDYDEALSFCKRMVDVVKDHSGEVVLLWHNTTLAAGWQKQLYVAVTKYLCETME